MAQKLSKRLLKMNKIIDFIEKIILRLLGYK